MQSTSSKYVLEIACFDVESCLLAEQAGAYRVEFCADYLAGGITPKHQDILNLKQLLKIPLHVIIRPRGGNFVYSNDDLNTMKQDIMFCKTCHVNGVVFGTLDSDNTINTDANKQLIELAKPMSVTFHRAIDECVDIETALCKLVDLGFTRVLTSGGQKNALNGVETIKNLQHKFQNKITIMPGGGIRSYNLKMVLQETGCYEFHSAALINNAINTEEIKRLKDTLT
jgi:copper homeostasis protein